MAYFWIWPGFDRSADYGESTARTEERACSGKFRDFGVHLLDVINLQSFFHKLCVRNPLEYPRHGSDHPCR